MAVTLTASQVPLVQVPAAGVSLSQAESSTGAARVAKSVAQGDTSAVLTKLNRNAAELDAAGTWGGNGYCIAWGLGLSAGSGLVLNVADGTACIGGMVQPTSAAGSVGAGGTITLTNNTRNFVWLKQDGSLYAATTTTAPSGGACYLGSALTSAGAISSIDMAGVVYSRGGMLYRETADTDVPGDTPSASICYLTKTTGGTFLWDGAAYFRQVTATRNTIADPASMTAPSTMGVIYSQTEVQHLRDDVAALRTALVALNNELRANKKLIG